MRGIGEALRTKLVAEDIQTMSDGSVATVLAHTVTATMATAALIVSSRVVNSRLRGLYAARDP
jgi:hypothetical protein